MTRFKEILPKVLPTGAALLLFFIGSALYFAPQFRGEVLPQHDVQQYEGMAKEIWDNRAQTGEDPQWAGRMFGGMPAYLINVAYPAQLVKNTAGQIVKIINTPAAFVFFAMVSMWLMLPIVGVNPWVGIIPSLMYGLSTYFFLIIGAGHVTKMWALVYAPLMMGGAWLTLRGNMWLGGALTALFASLEIGANHPQITYYFLLAMAALWISEGIVAFRKKHLPSFVRRTAVLLAAGILAVGSNFAPLWYTRHHSKQTIRGGSDPELRTRRKREPADSRLHGRRFGAGVHTRRQGSRGLETVRAGGYRGATARLLGAAALHCRTDLPGRRRPVPGSAGTPAGIGTQLVVDRSRQSADAFAGLGT